MSEQDGVSAEQHAQAWATYYTQQGYTPDQVYASTGYDVNTGVFYGAPGAGQGAAAGPSSYGAGTGADALAQSNMYDPEASAAALAKQSKPKVAAKRETVVRKGNGKVWEDATLVDWDPKWYRLFVGDVSNDVSERTLDQAFSVYPSYCKCKVVRNRLSLKSLYGFIAFKDPEDFLRAWKEMDGKYVGQRPIRLMKVREDKYGGIETKSVGGRKAKELDKIKKNHGKPLDGRPTPY